MKPASSEQALQPAPIGVDDLVGNVLARDEALVEVFVRHSLAFDKLRNPVLRRTMAKLVSVRQAAGVAGVSPEALCRDLNAALGLDLPSGQEAAATPTVPEPAPQSTVARVSPPASLREVALDLRDDLRRGQEPFSRIMAAVGTLGEGEVLRLRTIFEPEPLYAVLARRGLQHATEAHAADDWSVWFWPSVVTVAAPADDTGSTAREVPADEVWLDVRGLEPPEPMVRTLAALEALPAGATLVQVNVRVPQFLLPILAERGFVADIDDSRRDQVHVRIRRDTPSSTRGA